MMMCVAEPYREENGETGFAIIERLDSPRPYCETLRELKEGDQALCEQLVHLVNSICWVSRNCGLPGRPDLEREDPGLLRDVALFISEHVEFPDDRYCYLLASWVICSWVPELMDHAPRVIFYGPTRSGKSRALKTIRLLSYRGMDLINPSGAALFRIIEQHRPTVLIDEYHSLSGDRAAEVDLLFKGGYENGSKIPRARREGKEIDFFDAFSFLAVATKRLPAEDLQNRAILVNMLERSKDNIRRRMDFDTASQLKTRLLAFRVRVLSGLIDLNPAIEKARKAAEEAISLDGNAVFLDDRGIDIASSLLIPCSHFGDNGEVLQLIAISQGKARMELLETPEAQVFFAMQVVLRPRRMVAVDGSLTHDAARVSTRDIAEQLNQDLAVQGERDVDKDKVPTGRVTKAIKVLGFGVKRGAHNLSYIDSANFEQVYEANLRKFGERARAEQDNQVNPDVNQRTIEGASVPRPEEEG